MNLVTGDGPVRSAVKVVEAEGAKYIGLLILLVILVPVVVIISLDVLKLVKDCSCTQHRNKPRLLRNAGRITPL